MKILQLAPVWETVPPPAYGGTETVVSTLTEELVRMGHEVTLCASGDSRTSARLLSWCPRSLRPAGMTDEALQFSLMHVVMALREAGNYDVVHNHSGPPSELAMALSHLVDVPMLTTLHNQLGEDTRFIWKNYRGWYNTISRSQEAQLPPLPAARFAGSVHNAIDVESFPFSADKDDYLLFIGRMMPDKGPHLAAEAARRSGHRLVMAGKVAAPEEREFFANVLRPMLDGSRAEYVGEADAELKRELYRRAKAVLVPLQWEEPFGLVMIEAMACGTPVIAFRRGAAPEIVKDGVTGFVVDNLEEMVAAIGDVEVIDAATCRAHVEENFSPGVLARGYLEIYQRMTGPRLLQVLQHA